MTRQSFQPASQGATLQFSERSISEGRHRLSLRIVRQVRSPSTYYIDVMAVVIHSATRSSQVFRLPDAGTLKSVSDGQSVDLDFTVQ
jgi:hypothetical protein